MEAATQKLKLENERLTEELAQCEMGHGEPSELAVKHSDFFSIIEEADKEFIWLLWKQFQKESPDLAASVDMVVTREKMKQEEMNRQASLTLLAKDNELSLLRSLIDDKEQELSDQRKRLNEVETQYHLLQKEFKAQARISDQQAQQISELLSKNEEFLRQKCDLDHLIEEGCVQIKTLEQDLIQRETLTQELKIKTQNLNSLQDKVVEYQKLTKRLETECQVVTEKCYCLCQQLQLKDEKLKKERDDIQQKDFKINDLREQLEEKTDSFDKQLVLHSSITQQLHSENSQLKADLVCMEEKLQSMIQEKEQYDVSLKALHEARLKQLHLDTSSTATGKEPARLEVDELTSNLLDSDVTKLIKILEITEKELFECKMQLKAKSEELIGLRSSHDRRLERMKSLELNYKLLQEQLQTYEPKSKKKPLKATVQRKGINKSLRHENCDEVWNELALYKTTCDDLRKQMLYLEEERDAFQTKCLRNQTTIAELRASLHHQKSDLERKLIAIATVESFSIEESSSQSEVKDLQLKVEELITENKQTLKQKVELEQELELQQKEVIKLQLLIEKYKDVEVSKRKRLCKSSRSKVNIAPVTQICAAIQATAEMKDVQVSTQKLSDPSTMSILKVQRSHRRTASDGEIHLGSGLRHINLICEKDKQQCSGLSHSSAVTTVSSKVHSHTTERGMRCHKASQHKRESSSHHCLWQDKIRSLQQRLKTVSEQVSVLTKTKMSLIQDLEVNKVASEKAKKDCKDLLLRLEGLKSTQNHLQIEKQELQQVIEKQQKTITELEREATLFGKRTDVEWKRLEADQKNLRERCLTFKTSIKSLEENLHQKTVEVSHMQEINTRAERDLKQKRQLIEDLKGKLKTEKEKYSEMQEKCKSFKSESTSLSESVEHQKRKIETLRSQLSHQTTYKERLMEMLKNCQKELEHSIHQLNISEDRHKHKKKEAADAELKYKVHLEELEKRHRDKLHETECSLIEAENTIQELKIFVTDLAKELLCHLSLYHSHVLKHVPLTKSCVSTRVREIARDTLNMSELDLDDFLGEKKLTDKTEANDERLQQFLDLIRLTMKLKPPFSDKLLKTFTKFLFR